MPLQLPNLDDRRYADLMEEALSLIPTYEPKWTNHNPSDPGITLVELFAYLSEMLIYRLNRVTSANVLSFLKLLNGENWRPLGKKPEELSVEEIARQVPITILSLRKLERAVTCEDFETLALEVEGVARARCLPRRNMEIDSEREKAGHVSVIILPQPQAQSLADVLSAVRQYLQPKVLLTTRLSVVGPLFLQVGIQVTVVPLADEREANVKDQVVEQVRQFFDPLKGGENKKGWPFGRNMFVSEIYSLIDQLSRVDYVTEVALAPATPGRLINNEANQLVGIEVKPYELIDAKITAADVKITMP